MSQRRRRTTTSWSKWNDSHPVKRCCRPRIYAGTWLGEGKIPRVREVPCAPIVAVSLTFKADGTLPTLDEARAIVAAMPPSRRVVHLAVWT